MIRRFLPPSLLLALYLCAGADVAADSYRCGRKLIRTGDSSADVLRVCGEPGHKDRAAEVMQVNGSRKSISVERWYYKKSRRSLTRVVFIHQGKVIAIGTGDR